MKKAPSAVAVSFELNAAAQLHASQQMSFAKVKKLISKTSVEHAELLSRFVSDTV